MAKNYKCKVCGSIDILEFLDLGMMPIANGILKKEDLNKKEFKYRLKAGFCNNCKMVQLLHLVPYEKYIVPQENGKTHYVYVSSMSKVMTQHFADFANEIQERFLKDNDLVIEIGSNDGIMLQAFDQNKTKVLGIEPSDNVADMAKEKGIETIAKFFSEKLCKKIVKEKGKAKAILSANVILNIIDLHDLIKGVKELLTDDGVFVFEDPYIVEILKKAAYDQFYDEHIYYFSLHSLSNLFKMYGMEIFDAKEQSVHGGSMRIYARKINKEKPISDNVKKYLSKEKEIGIDTTKPYEKFEEKVNKTKEELINLFKKIKSENKRIVGYGAASKGNVIMNFCGIRNDVIEYISDSTPTKQGMFTPGTHVPIVPPEKFHNDNPDYTIIFPWNLAEEIMSKEQEYKTKGGKFIIPVPIARVV